MNKIRLEDERPEDVLEKIEKVALPENDPVYGKLTD